MANGRILGWDMPSRLVALATNILTLPKFRTDILVVFPGLAGETERLQMAIAEWQNVWDDTNQPKVFLVAQGWRDYFDFHRLQSPPFNLHRTEGVFIQEEPARNTKVQADWVVNHPEVAQTKGLTLCATPYHIIRCYLTLLKSWLKNGREPIFIVPSTTPISPFAPIPELASEGADGWSMTAGEVKRILTYQEMGDVATFKEAEAYLRWYWAWYQ